jgi:hypothetical protein
MVLVSSANEGSGESNVIKLPPPPRFGSRSPIAVFLLDERPKPAGRSFRGWSTGRGLGKSPLAQQCVRGRQPAAEGPVGLARIA